MATKRDARTVRLARLVAVSTGLAGFILAATSPPGGPDATRFGMQVRATATDAQVISRNAVVWSQPREAMAECESLRVVVTKSEIAISTSGGASPVDLVLPGAQFMPQVVGIFTDLD
ncbi:hypothetical protein HT102_11655, partial [Hoyosella sp. G463]|nr:hypothetical protein [Lolliginicoccus lacisalsi]